MRRYEVQVLEPEPVVRQRLREVGHTGRLFSHPGARVRNLRGKSMDVGGYVPRLSGCIN